MWHLAIALHHWYNAVEHIFERSCLTIEGALPKAGDWHQALLRDMALSLRSVRPPVVSETTLHALAEFLEFRHFLRHAYLATLDWERLSRLLDKHGSTHAALVREFDVWQEYLVNAATAAG